MLLTVNMITTKSGNKPAAATTKRIHAGITNQTAGTALSMWRVAIVAFNNRKIEKNCNGCMCIHMYVCICKYHVAGGLQVRSLRRLSCAQKRRNGLQHAIDDANIIVVGSGDDVANMRKLVVIIYIHTTKT